MIKISPYGILRALVKVTRSLSFYIYNFKKLDKILATLDVTNVQKFKFIDWHNGYSYFIAIKDRAKVFIKIDLNLHFLENDHLSYQIFNNKINVIPVEEFLSEKDYQVLISPFVDGRSLTEQDIINKPYLLEDIYNILHLLNNHGVIHRDIRLENFMIINESIFIIDFTFSSLLQNSGSKYPYKNLMMNIPMHRRVLQKLGARLNPSQYIWNDFHSVSQILNRILINHHLTPDIKKSVECYKAKFSRASTNLNATYNLNGKLNS